jgi:two-component system LytT family response regulator
VIVDDEPAGRAVVRTFLERVPEVDVVGEAGNGGDAIALVKALAPDLLFLDVQMPDRDGFAVLEALGDDMPRGVVLVTAHGEYAQKAFEVHALDYVMKPFGRPRFMAAVERALRRLEADEALGMKETLRSLMQSLLVDPGDVATSAADVAAGSGSRSARVGVRLGSRTVLVDVADIDWIEADGDLVRLHVGDRIHLLNARLRDFEATLSPDAFLRIHRSIIVNLGRVEVLHRERDGSGEVALRNGVRLRVARSRWEALEASLGLSGSG